MDMRRTHGRDARHRGSRWVALSFQGSAGDLRAWLKSLPSHGLVRDISAFTGSVPVVAAAGRLEGRRLRPPHGRRPGPVPLRRPSPRGDGH